MCFYAISLHLHKSLLINILDSKANIFKVLIFKGLIIYKRAEKIYSACIFGRFYRVIRLYAGRFKPIQVKGLLVFVPHPSPALPSLGLLHPSYHFSLERKKNLSDKTGYYLHFIDGFELIYAYQELTK